MYREGGRRQDVMEIHVFCINFSRHSTHIRGAIMTGLHAILARGGGVSEGREGEKRSGDEKWR
jgi:hypothetical protein